MLVDMNATLPDDVNDGYLSLTKTDEERYLKEMRLIVQSCQFCFMTISPKISPDMSDKEIINQWFYEFQQLRELTDNLVLVCEYTDKCQLHFHFLIKFNKLCDKFSFQKRFVKRWFFNSILLPVFNSPPKLGCKYFFKQYDMMRDILGHSPIFTLTELREHYKKTDIRSKAEAWSDDELI